MNKVILENFRPFYGMQELNIETSHEKPLILVKALNDVGKTSLFKAFYWCLYGGTNKRENQRLVNRSAAFKDDGFTSVELHFIHDTENYRIKRSLEFSQSDQNSFPNVWNEELEVFKNNKPVVLKNLSEQNEYIEAILPRDAIQFFLFDGEDIQKYTQRRPGEEVKKAIEMVLGIKELRNARSDLDGINDDLEREHSNLLTKQAKNKRDAEELNELEEDIYKIKETISDLNSKIESATDNRDFADEQLKQYSQIQGKVKERKDTEEKINNTKKEILLKEEEQRTFNQQFGFLIFSPLLSEFQVHASTTTASWKRDAIAAILSSNSNRCICDRPLTKPIIEKFERLTYQSKDTLLQYLAGESKNILENFDPKELEERLFDLSADRSNLESSLRSYADTKNRLDQEIGDFKDISDKIKTYEESRRRADDDINRYNKELIREEYSLEQKNNELRIKKNKLSKKMSSKDILDKRMHIASCALCVQAINEVVDRLVIDNKVNVEKLATDTFIQLTNAPSLYQGIEITDDYEIRIKTKGGSVRNVWDQDPSAGQSQIIAVSFISALNNFTAREAPVVIDTPIGRLDPIHKEKLIKYFPKIGPQVIILYQPSELNDEDIKPISRYINSEYELKRDSTEPDITLIKYLGDN